MNFKSFFTMLLTLTLAFQLNAQCESKPKATNVSLQTQSDIVDIAASLDDFSTLVAAVKAAGLVDVLKSDGPFTVFAPVNAAFDKLPEGTVNTLLQPENKDMLTGILTYHVLPAEVMAADVVSAIKKNGGKFSTETVQGQKITVMMRGDNVVIKDAKGNISTIVKTDVDASNGVIHVIDTVIMPKS